MPILMANEGGHYTRANTRSNARLVVLSHELVPNEVSALLALEPDRWWLAGEFGTHPQDPRWRHSQQQRFNGWVLASKLAEDAPAEAHLGDLLDRIGDAAPGVAALITDPRIHSVRVWLGHHTSNENPGLSLSHDLVQRLTRIGAGLEIDVYVE